MPPKRKTQKGAGIMDVLKFVKDNKLISRGLGIIPHPGLQAASTLAGMAGLGKKKKTHRKKQNGRGIFGDLGSGLGSVFGGLGSGVGSVAKGLFGAGKKKRKNVLKF